MEPVDPVPQRRVVRCERCHVRNRRRLLRVQAPVLHVGRRLALRLRDHHPHRHARRPLSQRRHPGAGARPTSDTTGQGAHLRAARPPRPGQGRRLLAAALLAHLFDPRHRRRCALHRCEGAAAGDLPAAVHRASVVRPVHREHLAARVDPPRRRRRTLGTRVGRRRRRLSGLRAALRGGARGIDP